ncbi:MAG: hypothetical protein M0Z82_11355 [Actinomycetota bacterium]|nr:hypothetical protein [Actinomycetota bacterium]
MPPAAILVVMVDADRRWLVLVRDVSHAISVRGHAELHAALVLDVATGLVRGVAVAPSELEALVDACRAARTKPAGSLPPGQPDRVLCAAELVHPVAEALGTLRPAGVLPPITEVVPGPEAEDIFDSFIGHMAGRAQPEEPPAPEDWRALVAQALALWRAEPWARWSDEIDLVLEVRVDGEATRHAAVVMGNAGLQRGLALYPGEDVPTGLRDWQPGEPVPAPPGTLLCLLDSPGEPPPELTAKAVRYGWPTEAALVPVFLELGDDDAGELDRAAARRMTVAIAAVLAHDARGPVLAHPAREPTSATVVLGDGGRASFAIYQRPPEPERAPTGLRVHRVGCDLVPRGTPVVLGHLTWAALGSLGSDARLYRPAPPGAPDPAGEELPVVAVLAGRREGDRVAADLARLDPYGIGVVETGDGQCVVTVVGATGAELLMELPADSPALADLRRRLRHSKGRHVVMVADEETSRGNGTVYGLFECHQPPASEERRRSQASKSRPKPRPKRRRR